MTHKIKLLSLLAILLFAIPVFSQPYSSDLCQPISGNCTSFSAWSGSYSAYYAFDNYTTNANCWASNAVPSVAVPQWLKYNFGSSPKVIVKYTVTARYYSSDQTRCPKDWTFEGSNDNTNWDILDTRTNETGWNTNTSPTTKREYTFANTTAYQYYRINITANNGGTSYVAIGEMEMMSNVVYTDYTSKRSNIWYFGNYAGLNFNTDPVSVMTDGAMIAREGCSSICDTAGNLLFYTNGAKVWNSTHVIMDNGDSLMVVLSPANPPHPTQAGVIVPNPGNSNQYYIFTVPCMWTSPSYDMYFRYALVDMSLNGGLGKVIQKDMRIGSFNATERITAVAHQNQHDIWVINREDNTNRFRAYLIKNTGIDTNNVVISDIGATSSGNCNMGCLKASPDGKKLAMAFWCDGGSAHYELYDFDNATGSISNLNNLGYPSGASRYSAYGVEFSPDGSKLYGTTHMDRHIHQWNLQAGTNADIVSSRVQIGTTSNYVGALQLAPNGKIYAALSIDGNTGYHTIGEISFPNMLGTACNYVDNGIRVDVNYTNANLSRQGFPNFIQSFLYAPPFSYVNVCLGDSTDFTISNTTNIIAAEWNFDDLASGSGNTSTLMTPSHVFSDTGTYSVQLVVTFNGGTTDTTIQEVTIFGIPVVDLGADTSLCITGSYIINAGNAGSSYIWNDNSTTQTYSVSSAGTYSVTVTNAYGCSAIDSIDINIAQDIIVNLGNDTTICEGTSLNLDAGNSGATFLWNDASTNETLLANSAGTYSVTVTNAGCTGTDSIIISVNPLPQASLSPNGSVSICNGSAQQIDVSGGDSYLWSTGEITSTIVVSPLADSTFYVTVSNSCGVDIDSVEFLLNGGSASITATLDSVCQGQSTDLTASGGTSYVWSTGETTQTITVNPLATTTYYVTVSGNGCNDSTNILIVVKPAITATSNPSEICYGGSAVLTVSPGTDYLWSTGETTQSITVSPASSTDYHVTVTNGGCSDSTIVPVTVNQLPVVALGNDTSICSGNYLILDAQNTGAGFLWSEGSQTQMLPVNVAGNYSVTVTDNNGCESSDNIAVGLNTLPVVNLGNDTLICSGSQIVLNAYLAGAEYLWSDSSTDSVFTVTSPGTYQVVVTDANNCNGTDEITISAATVPTVSLGNDTSICEGSALTLNAGSATSYVWSTGATSATINVNAQGDYSVTVTSSDNCTNSDTITVGINLLPVINLGNDTVICEGNSIQLDAGNSGSSYNWSTGETTQTLNVDLSGTYSVTVTSAYNCVSSKNIDVSVNSLPIITLQDVSFCSGDSAVIDALNTGLSYLWNNGATSQQIIVNSQGNYSVTVTDISGCTNSDTSLATVNMLPVINLNDVTACDSTTIDAGSGFTYLWSNGENTQTINVQSSATYIVTITDSNLCTSVDSSAVVINNSPVENLGGNHSACNSYTLDAGNWSLYSWSNGSTANPLIVNISGMYNVTITDANGCTALDSSFVTIFQNPTPNLGGNQSVCDSTTLNAGSGYSSYLWNDGSVNSSMFVSSNGTYSLTVTDTNGCNGTAAAVITILSSPSVDLGSNQEICDGTTLTLNAGSGYSYTWQDNSHLNTFTVSQSGTYSVTATNSCGQDVDSVEVVVNPLPVFDLGSDLTVYADTTITIDAGITVVTYLWSDGSNAQSVTLSPQDSTMIYLTVIDTNTCQFTDSVFIRVIEKPASSIIIYNTITPNDDGSNDVFYIENIEKYPDCNVQIFNRNGNLIFEKTGYTNEQGWDGKYNGKYVPASAYYYIIDLKNDEKIYKGHITVIR